MKYDWYGAINRLRNNPTRHPISKLAPALGFAEWFVHKWGDWAECARMQPAHLLKFDDPEGRGLAWRGVGMDVLCFPKPSAIILEGRANLFTYRFNPDGRTTLIFGIERADILGSFPELDAGPTVRAALLKSDAPPGMDWNSALRSQS